MKYIGIFDSGVGGLGIFDEIKTMMPHENILYLADSANCPYGEKATEKIQEICIKNSKFLIENEAKIIVVACNSASVTALKMLRTEFPTIAIVGVVPVVKTLAYASLNRRIGILATPRTIRSGYLKALVDEFCPASSGYKVFYEEASELVDLVENGKIDNSYDTINKYLKNFKKNKVHAIALGCTHFPFLKKQIEEIMGITVRVFDSNKAVANQVKRVLLNNKALENTSNKPSYKFFTSGDPEKLKSQISKLVNLNVDKISLIN